MSDEELDKLLLYAASCDNLEAMTEINAFIKFYGKIVEVVKGRKVAHGTYGEVFYVVRQRYGKFGTYGATILGFRDEKGKAFFTNVNNVVIKRN